MTASVATRLLDPKKTLQGAGNGDALENVIPDALEQGALCWVNDVPGLYYLDKYSTDAVSAPSIIATIHGAGVPGRWIRYVQANPGDPIVPLSRLVVVDPNGQAGPGTFSGNEVYLTLADAVAAVPTQTAILVVASTGEPSPVAWTDKRLYIFGYSLVEPTGHLIQLPDLQPHTTGFPTILMLSGVSCIVNPSNTANVIAMNCAIDARGDSQSNYLVSGAPVSSQFATTTLGLAVSGLTAYGTSIGLLKVNGGLLAVDCVFSSEGVTLGVQATIRDCDVGGVPLTYPTPTPLEIDIASLKTCGALTNCLVDLLDQQELSGTVYWDAQTVVPASHQNGTLNAPYSQLQDAIDAAGPTGGLILCAGTGDVSQNGAFDGAGLNNSLNLISLRGANSRDPVFVGTLTLTNHCHVTAFGIQFSVVNATHSRFWARCCSAGQITCTPDLRMSAYQAATPADASTPWAVGNVDASDGGTVAFFGMKVAGNIIIGGAFTTTENCFQQCDMAGGPGFSLFVANAATKVYIDQFSLASARRQNFFTGQPNNIGQLIIMDRPLILGAVYAVPAITGEFADVEVDFSVSNPEVKIRPGDTFDVTTTARLANVGIVDAFCANDDKVTLRFYGTNAGGNVTVNINVNANSGA